MSEKVHFFKLWTALNKENIFANIDCFKCIECKHSKKYQEHTELYKKMTKKLKINFTKCQNVNTEHINITFSHCPYFESSVSKA